MVITAILAGLAAIGAGFIIDIAERQKPALQPVRVKSNEGKTAKSRSR